MSGFIGGRIEMVFALVALLGMATAAIGVYFIHRCGDALLGLGVALEIVGGAAFFGGLASIIGIALTK